MVGQLVIFYLVNFCKILISKTTMELFCDQIPYCYLEKKNHQISTQIFLHSF
jgi:hypothetical protein